MPVVDLSTYLADDTLIIEGVASEKYPDGKSYTIPALNAEDWARYKHIFAKTMQKAAFNAEDEKIAEALLAGPDGNELSMSQKLLGAETYAEMLADGVSGPRMERIEEYLSVRYGFGQEGSELLLTAAGKAQAQANRASRRAAKKTPSRAATARKTAGSKSSRASGGTPASIRARTSTPTSRSTPAAPSGKRAKTA